jgi:hypothetical protein
MRGVSTLQVLIISVMLIVPVAGIVAGVVVQWFRTQERLRAIEKGIPIGELPPVGPPPPRPPLSPEEQTVNFRAGGIICVALGLGLLVLFSSLAQTIPQFPKGVIAVSAIPFLIGLGFLLEYRMRRGAIAARDRSGSQ